ncbi:MAG: histidine triad nucleotide-binding protein [Oscillospiraceae bacterium]|nr:histidine triad nucleotide-binding protein [Oscillospiraceae bacterium]
MKDCVFCKIISGEIPSTKVYEDEFAYSFKDIEPQAKVHAVVVPKEHVASLAAFEDGQYADLSAKLLTSVANTAKALGLSSDGYRVVTNIGEHGRQSVLHLHFHILGGESLPTNMGTR